MATTEAPMIINCVDDAVTEELRRAEIADRLQQLHLLRPDLATSLSDAKAHMFRLIAAGIIFTDATPSYTQK